MMRNVGHGTSARARKDLGTPTGRPSSSTSLALSGMFAQCGDGGVIAVQHGEGAGGKPAVMPKIAASAR